MEEETKVIQEAEIISEKIIEKPILTDPEAKIESVGVVTNNIKDVKENMLKLKEYYGKYLVTEDTRNEAKDEKAIINKTVSKIADFRKNIVNKFKEPINEFETEAKACELIGKEIYNLINSQIDALDEIKKITAKDELKRYFEEYKASKNLGFTQYSDMNQSVGLADINDKGTIAKKKYKEIEDFINNIVKDVDTIASMDCAEEILAEYMKDRDLSRSIKDVQNRHKTIESISQNKTELLQVNEVKVVEPVDVEVLKAPVVEDKPRKLKRAKFEIIYEDDQVAIDLVNFMKERGINYAVIK